MIRKLRRLFLRSLRAILILSVVYCLVVLINLIVEAPSSSQDADVIMNSGFASSLVEAIQIDTATSASVSAKGKTYCFYCVVVDQNFIQILHQLSEKAALE